MSLSLLRRFVWLLGAFLVGAISAQAHEGRPIYIELHAGEEGAYRLQWKIPPVLADSDLPVIALRGAACKPVGGIQALQKGRLIGVTHYNCEQGIPHVKLTYPDVNPVLSTLVRYKDEAGVDQSLLHGPKDTVIALPKRASVLQVVKSYTLTGIEHIISGYDHLAFVTCLMLLVLNRASGSLRRLIYTVTGFTVGHTLTLSIMTLSGLTLSPPLVEALIALSIVVLAAEIARGNKETLSYRSPVLVAIGFGLLHGLGFAGALSEIGLPQNMELMALAFFNVGVEVGQLLFIAGLLVLLRIANYCLGESKNVLAAMHYPLSLGIGSLGVFWVITRSMV